MLTILPDNFSSFPFAERILTAIRAQRKSILLVPEQLALATEKRVAEMFPPNAPIFFEVSNFSRLADRVFRAEGGISYRYADSAAETVLMWKTLDAASPFLSTPRRSTADTVKEHLSLLSELSASGVRPKDLRQAASALTQNEALRDKLSDLALITELFEGERREIYGSLADDLEKLLAILKEKPVFADTEIFVFGFTSFTAGELQILGELARTGTLFVALPLPEEKTRSLAYEEVLFTERALLAIADKVGSRVAFLPARECELPPMLAHAKRELFRADGAQTQYENTPSDGLALIAAKDPYDGCAHIAAEIASKIRQGARYRDFTIVARAPEKYTGILDEALTAQGIPFFFSAHTDLTELALSKMILSAYACLERGFLRADLIAYLKCGFAGISPDDCDIFELYAEKWRIGGRTLAENRPFDMHPRGFADQFTEEDTARLCRINAVREKILSPLLSLRDETVGEVCAKEHATALYRFLCTLSVEERLRVRAREERRQGREADADRLSRLIPVLYGLLDRITEIMGELPLTRARFAELLSLVFSSVSLGTIPSSQDAVLVANADTFRPTGEKTVFLLGAVEGEFPAAVGLGGAFPEEERALLENVGIAVGKPPEVRASREQFSFLRAIAAPKERAILVRFDADSLGKALRPSSAYLQVARIFPTLDEKRGAPDFFTPRAALEQYFEINGTAKGDAVASLLKEDASLSRMAEVKGTPVFDPSCTVSEESAARLFPDTLRASQSKLEDFLNCPFAYYCKRGLFLKEEEPATIRPVDVGNVIHAVLERFFDLIAKDGADIHTVAPERIPTYVERACEEYLARICPPSMQASPRLSHLFARVRRAAVLVARDIYDEFLHSRFTPAFCELSLEDKDGPGALVFRDKDGKCVSIGGRIDRVDTYRKENGELFVRVVDYKTGSRTFSRDEVQKGRNLQMFIYLCAIWKTENAAFLSRLSLKEGESPIPAGIVYNTADPKSPTLSSPASESEILDKIRKENFARRGFFLAEEDIVRAMDDNLSHLSVPQKNGMPKLESKNVFGSLVEFGELLDDAEEAVLATARRMRAGQADVAPDEKVNPCTYCPFVAVCRKEDIKKNNW